MCSCMCWPWYTKCFLTSKTFNWYSTSIDIIWHKSHSKWYMQGNYLPPEVCMVYNSFNWYSCQFYVILGLPPCMIWSKLSHSMSSCALDFHIIILCTHLVKSLAHVMLVRDFVIHLSNCSIGIFIDIIYLDHDSWN